MGRLGQIKPYELLKALEKEGFQIIRQSGSHVRMKHSDGRATSISIHRKPLPKGTLSAIIKELQLTRDEFIKLFRKKKIS